MKRTIGVYCILTLSMSALLVLAVAVHAADTRTEITLPSTRVFPESITSTPDGTLIVGSLGHRKVLRIAPGQTTAEEWIEAGTNGLNTVLGDYTDEKNKLLWVCPDKLGPTGEAPAVKTFDHKTGAPRDSYPLPGNPSRLFATTSPWSPTAWRTSPTRGRTARLHAEAGSKSLDTVVRAPLLAGADGLAFGDKTPCTSTA